jgi:hypothetical protein
MAGPVSFSGPLFDGKTAASFESSSAECAKALAEKLAKAWTNNLNASIKNGTGFYVSQIETRQDSADKYTVDDKDVVYGPWLEGLGSRNYPHTVFRGYMSLRKAKQTVQDKSMQICQPIINRLLGKG